MKSYKVSIIVPVYKVEQYIDECVTSIVNQSYRNLEIILVDDGSPDKCPEICDSWEKKDFRIKVIHKENGGLSSARNAGMSACTGEYVMFTDSDDFIDSCMVENLLKNAEYYDADVSACSIKKYYNGTSHDFRNYFKQEITEYTGLQAIEAMLREEIDCAAWNKLYRVASIKGFEFPLGRYNEDVIFLFYSWQKIKKIVYTKEAYYNYRVTANSLTHSFSEKRFDYMGNAKEIKNFIDGNIPELKKVGEIYLNICASNTLMDLWYANSITRYADYFKMCRKIVLRNYFTILTSPDYNTKTKIKSAIMSVIPFSLFKLLKR